MVTCLERGADLHMAQLMPLPLTVSCFSKIQIAFTFLVLAHLGSPGKGPFNGCACVYDAVPVVVIMIEFCLSVIQFKETSRALGTKIEDCWHAIETSQSGQHLNTDGFSHYLK